MAYRIDQTELGMTYVKEIDDPLGTGKQKFFREIQHAVFWGVARDNRQSNYSMVKGLLLLI